MASKYHKESQESMRFIDRLTDFLGTSEGQTNEEVKAELREQGIDIDKMLLQTKEMINQMVAAKKMEWLQDAPRIWEEMRKQIEADNAQMPHDIQTIKEKIKELLGIGEQQQEAFAFFRNFDKLNDDDLRQLYRDYIHLLNLKDSTSKNE
jgi:hypothetical protein